MRSAVGEDVGGSGRLGLGDLLLDLLVYVTVSFSEDERDRLGREIAAPDQPLVVLLDAQHPGKADEALVVGEDADEVGAPADLAVEALDREKIQCNSLSVPT